MSIDPADLEEAVLGMVPERRAKLARLLIRSLESPAAVDDKRIDGRWLIEAEERARQLDAGDVVLLSADRAWLSFAIVVDTRRDRAPRHDRKFAEGAGFRDE